MTKRSSRMAAWLVLIMFVVWLAAPMAPTANAAVTDISSTYQWNQVKTGAGGWVTGINWHPSGETAYVRTDVGGAYRLGSDKTSWIQLVTTGSMPDDAPYTMSGVISIAAAPSNSNAVYMAYHDSVYKSSNKGDSWSKTTISTGGNANGDGRQQGERLAVDPANENIVYYGTFFDGLQRSTNGGANWSQVSGVGISGNTNYGVGQVLFDPSGGTLSEGGQTKTRVIYAIVYQTGVYRSSDAGANWTKISGGTGPADNSIFEDMDIAPNGTFYLAAGSVWKYSGGSWTNISPNGSWYVDVAVSPNNSNKVYAFTPAGDAARSLSGGASGSWSFPTKSRVANDVPWLAWTDEEHMSVGSVVFDPVVADKLWFSQGIGVWSSTDINDGDLQWTSVSRGIEEMVTNDVLAPPGGKLVSAYWDRPVFYHQSLDQYPAQHKPTTRFNSAWDLDYSYDTPGFMVSTVYDHRFCCEWDGQANQSGYSTDGGQTWQRFGSLQNGTHPGDLKFGNIAVASNDTNNIVWLPTWNKAVHYSKDRGQTWNPVILPGTETMTDDQGNYNGGSHFALYLHRFALAADTVNDNTFYIYHQEKGIYRSTNGGTNWSLINTSIPKGWAQGFFHVQLQAVPGKAGHLYLTFGPHDGAEYSMYRSTDGGTSWTELSQLKHVSKFAFGKAAPGSNYPTFYLAGKVGGDYGVWRSVNEGADWEKIGTYPLGLYDTITAMDADKDVFGRVIIGFSGNSLVYGQPSGSGGTDNGIVSGATYEVINPNSGKALEVSGSSTADGANVQLWTNYHIATQQWIVTANGDGTYRLINANSNKGLDVDAGSSANGANVQQWTYGGAANQKWSIVSVGGGKYKLLASNSGKALDVSNGGTADGTNVQIWEDNGSPAQQWQFSLASGGSPVDSGSNYKLINPNSGKALDVSGSGTADGVNVQIWTDNGSSAQQWTITDNGDGTYRIINVNSSKGLDVAGVATADGSNVQQWSYVGGANQKWKIESAGNGYYKIIDSNSNKALDVASGGTADGTNVQIWTSANSSAQLWQLVKLN